MPSAEATAESTSGGRLGRGFWRGVALVVCATASLVLYAIQLSVVPNLGSAEHSFVGQVFPPFDRLLSGSLLEIRAGLSRTDYAAVHGHAAAQFLMIQIGLFVLYGLALWIVHKQPSLVLKLTAFGAGAAFLLVQLPSPATLSGDVFSYIIYGRMHALYGSNPYVETPDQNPSDPFLPLVYWKDVPSFYGPLWTLVSGLLVRVGGEQVGLTFLLFRVAAAVSTLLAGGLVWACLERASPLRVAQGLVFFLWNPLLVLESGLSAHNDVLMVSVLLWAMWLHLRGHEVAGVATLTVSTLVKFGTLPLIPLYALLVLRRCGGFRRRLQLLTASLAAVATLLTAILGLARVGSEALAVGALGSGVDRYHNSLLELVFARVRLAFGLESQWANVPIGFRPWWVRTHVVTELWTGPDPPARLLGSVDQWTPCLVLAPQEGVWLRVYDTVSEQVGYIFAADAGPVPRPPDVVTEEVWQRAVGPVASRATHVANTTVRLVGVAAFGALWLLAAWRSVELRAFVIWSAVLLLGFYYLVAAWFWPWYVVWVLGLAALVPTSRVSGFAAVLSAAVLSLYASQGFQGSSQDWIDEYRSLWSFVFPLVLFAASASLWWLFCAMRNRIRLLRRLPRSRIGTGTA